MGKFIVKVKNVTWFRYKWGTFHLLWGLGGAECNVQLQQVQNPFRLDFLQSVFRADRTNGMCMLARFGNFIFSCCILADVLWRFRLASLLFFQPVGYWISLRQFLPPPHISGCVTIVSGEPSPQIRASETSLQRIHKLYKTNKNPNEWYEILLKCLP